MSLLAIFVNNVGIISGHKTNTRIHKLNKTLIICFNLNGDRCAM